MARAKSSSCSPSTATIGFEAQRPVRKDFTTDKLRNNMDAAEYIPDDQAEHRAAPEEHFAEGELVQDSGVKDSFTTAADGKNDATKFYNLDTIISVGYRVKRAVATREEAFATNKESLSLQITSKVS